MEHDPEKEKEILAALGLMERRRNRILAPATRAEWARRLSEFRMDAVIPALEYFSDGGEEWIDCRKIVIEVKRRQAEILSRPEMVWASILAAFNRGQIEIGYPIAKQIEGGSNGIAGENFEPCENRPRELPGDPGPNL